MVTDTNEVLNSANCFIALFNSTNGVITFLILYDIFVFNMICFRFYIVGVVGRCGITNVREKIVNEKKKKIIRLIIKKPK